MNKDFFSKLEYLFCTDKILNYFDIKKEDLIAYYRYDYKIDEKNERIIKSFKNLYLTKNAILIADLKDNNINTSIIPIKTLNFDEVNISFNSFQDALVGRFDYINFNKIYFNNKLDELIPYPVSEEKQHIDFREDYEIFVKKLLEIALN